MKNNFKDLIEEICSLENIKVTYLSKNWLTILEKDNKCRVIAGYKFDIISHGLGEVCDDKYALYELLDYYKIPVVKHHIVYGSNNKNEYAMNCNDIEYLKQLFLQYNKSVILKSNNGTCGNCVYHITNMADLEKYYLKLSSCNFSLSLSPFIEIENEYRIIILDNNPELIYKKELPIVYGDGKSSIKKLLQCYNYEYFKNYDEDNKDVILKENEKYIHSWKFNLSKGAKANLEIPLKIKNEVLDLAINVAKKINLGFGSIDIIKDKDGNYYVLEINSGVMMDNFIKELANGYDIAKSIYYKAIKSMFK